MLNASYQGVKRLFVLTYRNSADNIDTADSHRRYFLSRVKIENYNIEIDERKFYDQPINDLIKQYGEVKKYQQDKVMIIQLVVYHVFLILKTITD